MSRTRSNIIPKINDDFDKNLHSFSTNDNVHIHNRNMLHSPRQPMAHIIATKISNFTGGDDNYTDEVDMELLITKQARVIFTSNLWIEGLVNGALSFCSWNCTTTYKPRTMPLELPLYVIVKFDTYSRSPFNEKKSKNSSNLSWTKRLYKSNTVAIGLGIDNTQISGFTTWKETIDIGPTEKNMNEIRLKISSKFIIGIVDSATIFLWSWENEKWEMTWKWTTEEKSLREIENVM